VFPKSLIVDYLAVSVGAVPQVASSDIWRVMLIFFVEDILVNVELLPASEHSPQPWQAGFEEPDQFIDVVAGDVGLPVGHEDGVEVAGLPGTHRTPVLAGRNRKVRV